MTGQFYPDPDQQRDALFDTLAQCEDVDLKRQTEEPTLEDRVAALEEENGKLRQALKVIVRAIADQGRRIEAGSYLFLYNQLMEETGLKDKEF